VCVSHSLYVSQCVAFSVNVSICLCVVSRYLCLSVSVYVSLSLCLSVCFYLSLSMCVSSCLKVWALLLFCSVYWQAYRFIVPLSLSLDQPACWHQMRNHVIKSNHITQPQTASPCTQ